MAKPIQVWLDARGVVDAGPYRVDLLDISYGGLRCVGELPIVPRGTRATAVFKVPAWLRSWQFDLAGTVLWIRESLCSSTGGREAALKFLPNGGSEDKRLRTYLRRAERAYRTLVAMQGIPSALAESLRMLQVKLGPALQGRPRLILISSAVSGEGKSFIAGNLAVQLVREGNRVLLVDTDFRRQTLHEAFGVQTDTGLAQWLESGHQTDLMKFAQPTRTGVVLIPAGMGPHSPELWAGASARALAEQLKKSNYSFIILDSPPILMSAVANQLAVEADDVILIVRAGDSRERDVREARSVLERSGAKLRGVVLNDQADWLERYTSGYYSDQGTRGPGSGRALRNGRGLRGAIPATFRLIVKG